MFIIFSNYAFSLFITIGQPGKRYLCCLKFDQNKCLEKRIIENVRIRRQELLWKIVKRCKQAVCPRGTPEAQQVPAKMLTLVNIQKNVNRKNNVLSLHTYYTVKSIINQATWGTQKPTCTAGKKVLAAASEEKSGLTQLSIHVPMTNDRVPRAHPCRR